MIAQSVGWKPVDVPVQTDFHIAGFIRIIIGPVYLLMKKISCMLSICLPFMERCSVGAFFPVGYCEATSVSAKLGYTYYVDRDVVGTDLEEIEGNIKADIYTLLRWKF